MAGVFWLSGHALKEFVSLDIATPISCLAQPLLDVFFRCC